MSTVTQQQYHLDEQALLVSYTDLQGNIIKANEAFVEASGYPWAELMEQPHNILRHPDVPKAVFKDLWDTIQDGRPWQQIVKNRRKNGDHYWVMARTTAMRNPQGKITGYMSVRRPANQAQIKQAEQAYRDIQAGRLKLKNGRPVRISDHLNLFANVNPMWSIIVTTILVVTTYLLTLIDVHIEHTMLPIIAAFTILSALHGYYFVKRVQYAIHEINKLAVGNFDTGIDAYGENMTGTLTRKLFSMQILLGDTLNSTRETLLSANRLEQALGELQANVMVTDQNNTIVYVNPSLVQLFGQLESNIKQRMSNFNHQQLIGKCIDDICYSGNSPLFQLSSLTAPLVIETHIGEHPLQMQLSPIVDQNQQRIGTSIELRDIYMERQIQAQLKDTISSASQGYIDGRISTQGLTGFYLELASQFNLLLGSTEATLNNIGSTMQQVANQNLTARINNSQQGSVGELNNNLNGSLDNLSNALKSMVSNIHQINQNIAQLNQANQDAANRTVQTAGALQEISSTIEEMNHATQRANSNTSKATQYAHEVKASAAKGVMAVSDSVSAMGEIENHSRKIEEITALIDSIAFQTNLLALNATVEAARAGEHGRGFAVVAGEVRALAGKSAEAAKDIRVLIEETVNKIQTGSQTVQSTAVALEEIEAQAVQVEQLVEELSLTSAEQTQAMNDIHHAVTRVDSMTQEAAIQSNFLVDMSNQMSAQATQVAKELNKFTF